MATPHPRSAAPSSRPARPHRKSGDSPGRPVLECLEQRLLLSASLVGVPNWFEEGPRPIVNAQLAVPPDNLAGGAVQAIAVNPTDSTNIYIATVNGGVWQTTNADPNNPGVITWTTTTDQFESLATSSVAFSTLDATGQTVYAGTGNFSNGFDGDDPIGLLRTTDGGATWELLGNDVFGDGVLRIKEVLPTGIDMDPGPGVQEVILVATIEGAGRGLSISRNPSTYGGGIYRSEDNGETWTHIAGGSTGLGDDAATQVIGDPNDVNTSYAGIPGEGVFRSTDGGETWDPINTSLTNLGGSSQIELAAHDDGASTVLYVGVATGNTLNGVWRSTNEGDTWNALAASPAGFSAGGSFHEKFNMVADPVANDIVYISGQGGSNINWRYNPAGAGSWVLIEAAGTLSSTRPHADSRDLEFLGDTVLLESDDGGIYFLKNPTNAAANDWQSFVGDLGAVEFWQIAYDSQNEVLVGGSQDNGSEGQVSVGGSLDWTRFRGGDGYAQDIDNSSADAGANVLRYSMSNNINTFTRTTYDNTNAIVAGPTTVGLKTAIGDANGSELKAADKNEGGFVFTPFALNTVDPRMLLVGKVGLYEDNDTSGANGLAGDVVVDITSDLPGLNNTLISILYGGVRDGVGYTNVALVGTWSGQLFFRGETGSAFSLELSTGSPVYGIAVDPNDYRRVFVVSDDKIWMTEDITDTASNPLTDITGNMGQLVPNVVLRSVAYVPGSGGKPDTLVVGGMGGVFRTVFAPSRFGTWTELGAGLPNTLASDLIYNATDDLLAVGTFGRGAWTIDNASDVVSAESSLQISGTSGDDVITLQRDPGNPSLLNVFINSFTPTATYQLSTIGYIDVSTGSGLDTLIVDNSNGMIAPPDGIRYDGGDEPDLLQVVAGDETDAVYDVGPGIGQGVVNVTAGAATQTIYFQDLEPVQIVGGGAGTALTVNGTASDNAVNYAEGPNSDDIGHLLFAGDLTGFVTVDNFESIEFSNYETLVLNGGSGSDVIHLNNTTTPTVLTDIDVNGGDDTVGDLLVVNGTAATVDVDVSGATITGTSGSGSTVDVDYATVENLTVVAGSSGELAVSGSSDYTVNPDAATDRGTILSAGIPIEYQGYGTGDTLALTGGGELVVNGTDTNDVFTVAGTSGDVTITGRATVERDGTTADLVLNGLDGDDTFDVTGSQPYTTILLAGGSPSASDVANLTGSGATVTADLDSDEVTGGGLGTVNLTGIEQLNIDAATGNLTVLTSGDDDTVDVTPLGTNHGSLQANGAAPVVNFSGVGDLTVNLLGGNDLLTVNASSGDDTITVDGTTVAVTGRQAVDYLGTESVIVNGLAGSDTFDVTPSASVSLFVDGGQPIAATPGDQLNVQTGGDPVELTMGPESDEGSFVVTAKQPISFDHMESFSILGGGPLVINGTNGPDAITIVARDGSTHGGADGVQDFTVSINASPEFLFLDVASVTVNALGGSDEIVLRTPAPNNADWDTDVTVNGGPPSASDRLVVETPGGAAETVTYTPTASDGGTLVIAEATPAAATNVTLTGIEELVYDGEGDDDSLTVLGTGGADTTVHTPGASDDAGTLQVNTTLALSYQNLGSSAALLADGDGDTDELVVNGTAGSDAFSVAATGSGGRIDLNTRLRLLAENTETATLEGFSGDDVFNVAGPSGFGTLNLLGGDPSASDVANLDGDGGSVTADLEASTVSGGGLGTVNLDGVEQVNIDAGTGDLTVQATTNDDTVEVTPLGAHSGTLQAGIAPEVNFEAVGTFSVDLRGGEDTLIVNGSAAVDIIDADGTSVTVSGREAVNYTNGENLVVDGLAGSDTVNVTPASGVSIFVDGGDPVGVLPGDLLSIDAGGDSVTFTPGPENDEGGFDVGANLPVSYDHIESLTVINPGPVIINGTNDSDRITVIARDASTHGGTDGVQDFTAAVNDSPEILFIDASLLTVNALAGDDLITLRTPAPNDADWDVDVTINGGPDSVTDRLIVETPGPVAETATYTPTGPDGGTLVIEEATPADATNVTIAEIEDLAYDGEDDGDVLRIVATAGDDVIVHTPGADDQSGGVQVNSLLAVAYQSMGAAGIVETDGADGADELVVHGTAVNDAFSVDTTVAGGRVDLNSRLPLLTENIQTATLEGLDGDDTFTLVPAISDSPFSTLNLNGGDQASASSDVAYLHGTAGDDAFALSGQTVMLGGVTVAGNGVEQIHLDGGGSDGDVITYNGVAGVSEDIELHAAVPPDAGQLLIPGVANYFYTGVMLFEVNGDDGTAGDTDTLTVKGTNGDDRFEIQMDAVGTTADPVLQLFDRDTDAALLTLLNYSMFPTLNIDSLDGGDLFNVYTGPTLGRQIFIDAGLPEGKKRRRPADRTDELYVFYVREPRRPAITHNTETQDPDSGLIDMVYDSGVRTVVQYANVEKVIIEVEGGDGDGGGGGGGGGNKGGNGKGKGPK